MSRAIKIVLSDTRNTILSAEAARRGVSPATLLQACVDGAVDTLLRPTVPPANLHAPAAVLAGAADDDLVVTLVMGDIPVPAVLLDGPKLRDHGTLTLDQDTWVFQGSRSALRLCARRVIP